MNHENETMYYLMYNIDDFCANLWEELLQVLQL